MNVDIAPPSTPLIRKTLDNGLTVLLRPTPGAPIASFWVWYRVGGRNEVPGITGISHWTEHMLFKGTESLPAGEIFRRVSAAGGTLNGFTWIDYTTYFETLPIDQLDLALEIESDRMINARFDPDEVASERTVIISERQGNENQPTFFLREEVNAASFHAHPYGQGVIGHISDLQEITREDLYRHYQTYYRPNNAIAVLAGNFDPDDAFERIQQRFGSIEPSPHVPSVRTVEPEPQGERRVTINRPAPNRVMMMTFLAPAASHPDVAALTVLDTIMSGGKPFSFSGAGGTIGRSSRFYRRFVSTGLAAGAGSSFSLSIDPYLFTISATLNPDTDPEEFESQLDEELERLREQPCGDAELNRAIRQLQAQWAYAQESVTSQAYWLGTLAVVAPERNPDTFIDEIEAVTAQDVQRVAQTYLTPDRRTVGWLIPSQDNS
ncbi:MAG: pitrilysin family protein [Thermomicrobiales bacterium]